MFYILWLTVQKSPIALLFYVYLSSRNTDTMPRPVSHVLETELILLWIGSVPYRKKEEKTLPQLPNYSFELCIRKSNNRSSV